MNVIYAATEVGVFKADITSNLLIDFNNWQQLFNGRDFKGVTTFKNEFICYRKLKTIYF